MAELRAFGVSTELEFVWSTDGSGVEDDSPRRVHIHRNVVTAGAAPARVKALAERVVGVDPHSVIRHEVGHALLFLDPRASKSHGFRKHFGDVAKRYRVGSSIDEVTKRLERHAGLANPRYRRVVSLYAAAHPHEGFAEAVRVALATGGDTEKIDEWIQTHGVDASVRAQILYAANWLSGYKVR